MVKTPCIKPRFDEDPIKPPYNPITKSFDHDVESCVGLHVSRGRVRNPDVEKLTS